MNSRNLTLFIHQKHVGWGCSSVVAVSKFFFFGQIIRFYKQAPKIQRIKVHRTYATGIKWHNQKRENTTKKKKNFLPQQEPSQSTKSLKSIEPTFMYNFTNKCYSIESRTNQKAQGANHLGWTEDISILGNIFVIGSQRRSCHFLRSYILQRFSQKCDTRDSYFFFISK